jgi:hypothetical protein
MTEQVADQPHVVFAAKIVDIAATENLDANTVFNGIATAAAAMLVDFVADEDGNVDEMSLKYAITNFKTSLERATSFAVSQLSQIVIATEIPA